MDLPKKVFVSYKYSDVVEGRDVSFNFRDDLIERLGERGLIHKGEDEESFDLSDYTNQQIIDKIAPYIKKSSITVVLLTPNAKYSKWIPWEISMSLQTRTYKYEQNMTRNGVIGVFLPVNSLKVPDKRGSYDIYRYKKICGTVKYNFEFLPAIIKDNIQNLKGGARTCWLGCCNDVYSPSEGSYIELVDWHNFVSNIDAYIERAWKRRNNYDKYECRIRLNGGK